MAVGKSFAPLAYISQFGSLVRKLNYLSSSDMSLMSSNRDVNSFTYSRMVPICFNFCRATLAIHPVLQGKNYSLNSFFNSSHELKVLRSTWASSVWRLLYWSMASPVKYMPTKETCSLSGTLATMKYCSISQINSVVAFRTP